MTATVVNISNDVKGPDRIRLIMRQEKLKQKDIAKTIGISEAQLSFMMNEERSISPDVARLIANRYGGQTNDFIWNVSHKPIPKGLITGEALIQLCAENEVLKGADKSNISFSEVGLRLARLISVSDEDHPSKRVDCEIAEKSHQLKSGQIACVTFLEEIYLPKDIRAEIFLYNLQPAEIFSSAHVVLPPETNNCNPIVLHYWGDKPTSLKMGDVKFAVSFTKL